MKKPFLLTAVRHGLLLLLLAGVLHALPGRAQTPQFMTYQGYLTDQNGNALATNGPQAYDIVFRIWPAATGGSTPIYGELQTVTVANGYFSVLLGQGNSYVNGGITDPRPPLSTVFTNSSGATNRYVEMTVKGLNNGADVVILPRLQLVTAPYAFMAANANALVSPATGSTLISSSGTNVIFNAPFEANSVTNTGNFTDFGGGFYLDNAQEMYAKNSAGTYEPFFWPRWSDNVTYLNYGSGGFNIRNDSSTTTMWMGNNGLVGINNTSPEETLSVAGFGVGANQFISVKTQGGNLYEAGLRFRHFNDTDGMDLVDSELGASNGLIFVSYPYGSTPFTAMYLDRYSGDLGVDTITPQRRLQVNGPGATPGQDYSYQAGIGTGTSQVILGYDTTDNVGLIAASTYDSLWRNLAICPGGGYVGIGTVSPAYTLDVNGSFHANSEYISGGATISGGSVYLNQTVDNSSGNLEIGYGGYSNTKVAIKTSESYALYVDAGATAASAYFNGNVIVGGTLSKGGGSFKIDHPLDPENKWLYHSFVESPDMMNVYNGNVVTDDKGDATIVLPSYFQALNRDFRYQLTVIGQFAQAMVSSEISSNSIGINFGIKTDKPGVKVSWQVTGIRQDNFANAHRIIPEVPKVGDEVGKYIHPLENGQPESKRYNPGKPTAAKSE